MATVRVRAGISSAIRMPIGKHPDGRPITQTVVLTEHQPFADTDPIVAYVRDELGWDAFVGDGDPAGVRRGRRGAVESADVAELR